MKKGYIYIALATVLFSSMEIALKIFSSDFNPIQINFLRFFIGSVILFPLAVRGLKSRRVSLKAGDFAFFAVTGFICVVVSMVLYQMAVIYSPASSVAVLFSCNPVFVVIFASILLKEKIYRHTAISVAVSLIGIIVILDPLHMAGSFTGLVLTVLASVTFAFYSVIGRRRSGKYGSFALTCMSFAFGSAEMLLLILLTKLAPVAALMKKTGLGSFADIPVLAGINLHTLPGLLYIGVFVTGLGYAFYFMAMETTSAATASLVFYIKPVLAPLLALAILGEPITPTMVVGIAFIIAGSLISLVPGLRRTALKPNHTQ